MAYEYIILNNRRSEWETGQAVARRLLAMTRATEGIPYLPVHGDPLLARLDDTDLLCYFIYSLSSRWEIPLIDRINSNREDNNFAILMDINPAPETMYRLGNVENRSPADRYKSGLRMMFESIDQTAVDAMYNLLRNGFGHNLFGREPGKIRFDNGFECPPTLDSRNALLIPPVKLAISMVHAFLARILSLGLFPSEDAMRIFKMYMTSSA